VVAEATTSAVGFSFPLILWLVLQLATIALTTSRTPLWANYPKTSEQLTLKALLVTQIVSAALLFPFLLRSVGSTIATLATSLPFMLVAAGISSTAISQTLWAAAYVGGWIISLAAWVPNLRSDGLKRGAIALATCIALAGPALTYLRADYGPKSETGSRDFAEITPIPVVYRILLERRSNPADWTVPLVLLLSAAATAILTRIKTRQKM
jgi:hypothetical protein